MPLLVGAIIGEVLLDVGENLTHRGPLLGSTADGHTHESGVAVRIIQHKIIQLLINAAMSNVSNIIME